MNDALPSRAAHYRALAVQAAEAARAMDDPHNKRIMQRVAIGYENLASHAEALERTTQLVASIIGPKEKPV